MALVCLPNAGFGLLEKTLHRADSRTDRSFGLSPKNICSVNPDPGTINPLAWISCSGGVRPLLHQGAKLPNLSELLLRYTNNLDLFQSTERIRYRWGAFCR
jgi:hypothetical protein